MYGCVSTELEISVPASKAWELYGTLQLAKLVEEKLPLIDKIELVQGDGGVGTILHLIFATSSGLSSYKEKYTKIDEENRIKEAEVVEGGYLELGFTLYRVRFEIIDKGFDKCIVRSTIEYEAKDDDSCQASQLVSIKPLQEIAKLAASDLLQGRDTNA